VQHTPPPSIAVVGLSESLRGELRGSGIAVSIVMAGNHCNRDGRRARLGAPVCARSSRLLWGEAIVRAVRRGRGADVYVPGYTGHDQQPLMSVFAADLTRRNSPSHARQTTVLTDVDQSARAPDTIHTPRKPRTKPRGDPQFNCAAAVNTRPSALPADRGYVKSVARKTYSRDTDLLPTDPSDGYTTHTPPHSPTPNTREKERTCQALLMAMHSQISRWQGKLIGENFHAWPDEVSPRFRGQ